MIWLWCMDYVWTQLFLKQGLYTCSLGSNCALIEDSGRSPRVSLAWPFMCSVKAHAYFVTILPAQTFGHPTEFIFISIQVCNTGRHCAGLPQPGREMSNPLDGFFSKNLNSPGGLRALRAGKPPRYPPERVWRLKASIHESA